MGDFLSRQPAPGWTAQVGVQTTAKETLQAICSTDVAFEAFQEVIAQIESGNRCRARHDHPRDRRPTW
jgi:hypothetical protein